MTRCFVLHYFVDAYGYKYEALSIAFATLAEAQDLAVPELGDYIVEVVSGN
jgi:hypothetical protein